MSEWELHIKYGGKTHKLKTAIEYESSQVMRIRVQGKAGSLLLENDYPLIKNGKKGMKWKLREGKFETDDKTANDLLTAITNELEYFIKGKHKQISHADWLRENKN